MYKGVKSRSIHSSVTHGDLLLGLVLSSVLVHLKHLYTEKVAQISKLKCHIFFNNVYNLSNVALRLNTEF